MRFGGNDLPLLIEIEISSNMNHINNLIFDVQTCRSKLRCQENVNGPEAHVNAKRVENFREKRARARDSPTAESIPTLPVECKTRAASQTREPSRRFANAFEQERNRDQRALACVRL